MKMRPLSRLILSFCTPLFLAIFMLNLTFLCVDNSFAGVVDDSSLEMYKLISNALAIFVVVLAIAFKVADANKYSQNSKALYAALAVECADEMLHPRAQERNLIDNYLDRYVTRFINQKIYRSIDTASRKFAFREAFGVFPQDGNLKNSATDASNKVFMNVLLNSTLLLIAHILFLFFIPMWSIL